jgi:hypothetical protein
MNERRNQSGAGRRLRAAVQAWSLALLASFLLAVPTVRTNELHEIGAAKERVEDATLVTRATSKRACQDVRCDVAVHAASIQTRLDRQRRVEPSHVDGHRLANDLLAPMTC